MFVSESDCKIMVAALVLPFPSIALLCIMHGLTGISKIESGVDPKKDACHVHRLPEAKNLVPTPDFMNLPEDLALSLADTFL